MAGQISQYRQDVNQLNITLQEIQNHLNKEMVQSLAYSKEVEIYK